MKCPECGATLQKTGSDYYECPECLLAGTEADMEYYDEDDHGGMDVYEAALLWQGSGEDEAQMYGYTEDELRDAL